MSLSPQEFADFRVFLKDAAGIDLGDNKQYLVTTRVRRILIDNKMASLGDLTAKVRQPGERELRQLVIDAMTTNETFWFRDIYPFEFLKTKIFPDLRQQNSLGTTRIWCAACSSGQEPYSISITTDEYIKRNFGVSNFPLEIHATDLSSVVLDQAKAGVYDKLSISRGMSDQRLREFFKPSGENRWEINSQLKQRVRFRALNLLDSYIAMGKFDIIFCRNVLIYFSSELKQDILRRIHAALKPGGYLFLGSSESLGAAGELFQMIHCNPGVVYMTK